MSYQPPQQMPPGWYPDPAMPGFQRAWDGSQWVGNPVKVGAKGGFPKWLIPVFACIGLALVAVVGGAIAGSSDDGEETAVVEPGPDDIARCNDGAFSDNPDLSAICSSHDGVAAFLASHGECEDGTVIALRDEPECPSSGDLVRLRPGYVPAAGPGDIARCEDGLFSDNRDLSATCSSHDGVAEWLADYGRCAGGEVIRLTGRPRCPGGEDLAELMPRDYVPPTTTTAASTTTAPPTTTEPPPTTTDPFAGESASQRNARLKAQQYLDFQAFSRTGLIDQLKYEGFNDADAAYGVDALQVDWNAQAAAKAEQYLEFQPFSRQGLIDQLLYEGFTPAEAEYGVSTTGL